MVTSGKNRDAEVKTEVKGEVIVTSGKNWDAEEKTEVKGEVIVTSGKNWDAEEKTEVKGEVIVTSGKNWDAEEKTEVKGEVIVTSGKNWDAEVKTEVKAEVKAPVERVVAIVQCGQAPVEQDKEVVDCSGCSLEYRQFLEEYGGKVEKLITLCQNHGVILKEKNCDKCGEKCRLDMQRKSFRCDKSFVANRKKRKRCNFVVSIYKGTWFDHTKLDIETHLKFVVLFLRTSFQYQIARNELSLSTMSINWWCSFCREVLISFGLDHHCDSIGGSGLTVEICESKYRKRKYNAGRVRDCQWIFCGFCRESRDFFMVPVQYRNEETLLSIIKDKIANGTTIISDCWKVYDCLQQEGYRHLQANQSINFVDPETKALTYTIERPWRNFTEHMPKYGRRTYNFVDYLATSYFKGHFKDARERFHHFLITAGKLFPPTPQGPQPVDNMKAMEPAAPMISVPAGVLKEFMSSTPSPTAASLVNDTTPTPSPKAPSLTRTPSPDLPNHCNVSALPTDKHPLTNGDMNSDSNKSDMEKNKPPNPINLGSSITVTSEKLRPESESVNAETDKNIVNNVEPEKKMLNGTIGTSLKRPSEEEEEEDDCSKYPDLKKIRVFAEEKNKSVESTVLEFNKLLHKESKKLGDTTEDDIMCLSSSVTANKPENRTISDSSSSESAKPVPVSESVHSNTNSVVSFENKSNLSQQKYESTSTTKHENSILENNLFKHEDKKSSEIPKSDAKMNTTVIPEKENLSLFASDLQVLTPSREIDVAKQENTKYCGKLKKLSRKELEKAVMRLFSEKTLYQCEVGRQKQLCEKLETTLEANRKKTAQFHKEIEDLRKVTNRLGAEQASRKGQYVAPIRIKRSVGIQAAPHIINKGLQHAQGQNSSIKTIAPRSSLSPLKPLAGVGGPGRIQNNSPNVAFHTKMIPGNNQNMLPGGAVGMLSTSQPGGRPQALSTSIIQGTGITTLANTTCPVGTVTHPAGSIGTVRPASGQMLMMTQSAPGMMQALPRPAVAGGVVVTANKTVVPVVQGRVVRSSVVPITNILSSGSILSTQRPMLIQNKEVTATTNAVNTPLFSRGSGVVDLTADEGRSTVGRTSTVLPAPGTLVKVPVTGTTQLVAIPQSGVVLLPNASAGAALVVSQVSGVQAVSNVANPIVAQARTGTVTSTPRGMGGSFRPISATSASSSVVAQHRHPAPLPRTPVQQVAGITKKLPPQPTLKLSHKDNSIVLSWTMGKTEDHEAIASYQLYAYQEGTLPPSAALWKKVGSVKALELPMACTLTQFMPGHVYHFAVRAVDAKSRLGPFSEPRSIRLEKK